MLEREVHLRGKIKSAMTYPVAVVGLVVLIMSAMLLFVVPQFEGIYEQLGGSCRCRPAPCSAISDVFKSYWYIVIGVRRSSAGTCSAGSRRPSRDAPPSTR